MGQVTCTTGQVPHSSSGLPLVATSAVVEVHGDEPGQTLRMGSPVHAPRVGEHSGLVVSAVLLQPMVVRRPGVQVKVEPVRQPQSRVVPVEAAVHAAVTPVVVPPQAVVERTQVLALAEQPEMVLVGPDVDPVAQRPALEHQPHPVAAAAAQELQVASAAQGSVMGTSTGGGHAPQSDGHDEQVSPREAEHMLSPQKSSTGTSTGGGHAPQSRGHDEHDSSPLQMPSPHEGPTSGVTGMSGVTGTSGVTTTSIGAGLSVGAGTSGLTFASVPTGTSGVEVVSAVAAVSSAVLASSAGGPL